MYSALWLWLIKFCMRHMMAWVCKFWLHAFHLPSFFGIRLPLKLQSDGQLERTIQTLEDMLRACVLDFKTQWDESLSLGEFDCRVVMDRFGILTTETWGKNKHAQVKSAGLPHRGSRAGSALSFLVWLIAYYSTILIKLTKWIGRNAVGAKD